MRVEVFSMWNKINHHICQGHQFMASPVADSNEDLNRLTSKSRQRLRICFFVLLLLGLRPWLRGEMGPFAFSTFIQGKRHVTPRAAFLSDSDELPFSVGNSTSSFWVASGYCWIKWSSERRTFFICINCLLFKILLGVILLLHRRKAPLYRTKAIIKIAGSR